VLRARRLAAMAGSALALALLCSSASLAGGTTTAPSQKVTVYFVITDQKIAYEILRATTGGGGDVTLEKYVLRGDYATIVVINRGKKKHGFTFLGKKLVVTPGHRAHFFRPLLVRGAFPYRSTTDPGKAFRGVFPVY
jgi:hypothetical protein